MRSMVEWVCRMGLGGRLSPLHRFAVPLPQWGRRRAALPQSFVIPDAAKR
jgi:hypothetical protein